MKLSLLATIAAVAITSTEACAKYKTCWCERSNFMYEGRLQDNIPWDEDTKSFFAFIPSKAINNCDWTKKCQSVGATTGYCREKI
ncbi:uncharacterized protein CLUP02_16619 [Colletotrichum lupini]|uniref:Uncharacterized protein n=1 Tax=Colletotrichum lupini TaxID=145971 RepID=A0A9Q8WQB9_9PEZI|nr:uncharacterized protein CLUP02_16619 [Colletotrichum lupini]UQC91085.1 hypothetical protein CLUP02_16619 [Colletotrichum lupini]